MVSVKKNWIEYGNKSYDLIKTGTLLKLKDGQVFLVGDVNELLGLCDCCKQYDIEFYCNDLVESIDKLIHEP